MMPPEDVFAEREIRELYCRDLPELLAEAGEDAELIELIDGGYLVEQARSTRSFDETHRTLLQFALPAARRQRDRRRLVTYGAALLHVARLGDALVETRLLEDLVASERAELAYDVVGRLTDPYALGRACATLLKTRPASPDAKTWSRRAEETFLIWLQRACPEEGEPAILEILSVLGKKLDSLWPIETARSVHWSALHGATAVAYLRNGPSTDPEAWRHLRASAVEAIPDVADALVDGLEQAGLRWETLLDHLEQTVCLRPAVGWPLCSGVFFRLEEIAPDDRRLEEIQASAIRRARNALPTSDQIWSGRRLFSRFPPLPGEPCEARTMLAIVSLVRSSDDFRSNDERISRFVERAADAATWFRLVTRWIEVLAELRPDLATFRLGKALRRVTVGGIVDGAEDVLRLLSAVARLEPPKLRRTLRLVFIANPSLPLLLDLARRARRVEILDVLVEEVEGLALLVSDNQLESFRTRRKVLESVLRNLLSGMDTIAGEDFERRLEAIRLRLLKEEWADLLDRSVAAVVCPRRAASLDPLLAETGHPRTRAWLALRFGEHSTGLDDPSTGEAAGDPTTLVLATSTVDRLADELESIEVLASVPLEVDATVDRLIERIQDEEIRQMALLRYAESAIRKEEEIWGQLSDRRGVVVGVQRALVTSSPLRLATLTPTLVELGRRMDPRRGGAETIEAMLQLMDTHSVPAETRLRILEDLVADAVRHELRTDAPGGPRRLGSVLDRALRIPLAWPDRDRVSRNLSFRLWPWVIAHCERLPEVWQQRSAPWSSRLRSWFRRDEAWWLRTLRTFARGEAPETLSVLCLAPPSRRADKIRSLLKDPQAEEELLGAAAILSASLEGTLALDCLRRISAGPRRDRLSAYLFEVRSARLGRVSKDIEQEIGSLAGKAPRLLLSARFRKTPDLFSALWSAAIVEGTLDPVDPRTEELLRALREGTSGMTEAAFERALISAAGRGALPLERALRLYLHFLLGKGGFERPSDPGSGFGGAIRRSQELFAMGGGLDDHGS